MIIEWPPNGLFQDACDVNLTSQMAVIELEDDDDDNAWPLGTQNLRYNTVISR